MTCNIQAVEYGTVNLQNVPIKTRAAMTPMYADDGVTVKYFKYVLMAEFVYAVPQTYVDANGHTSADDYLDSIKNELSSPGKPLKFNYRGFGKSIECTSKDVVYGPYPSVVEWEPIGGNQAVRVRWQVDFATVRCAITNAPETDTPQTFKILQLVEDSNLSYDEEGAVVVQTNGTMEVSYDSLLTQAKLKAFVAWFYPVNLTTFSRTYDVTLRKDKRTIDFRITDTEIKSDNPMYPYMVSQSVDHTVSSSLFNADPLAGSGFRTWTNDLNGTFKVRPGAWKGWAYLAFINVLQQRLFRISTTNQPGDRLAIDQNDKPNVATGDADAARKARKKLVPKQIPLYLQFKESIFARTVSVSSKWVTTCSLRDLFRSTGLFYPVNNKFQGKAIGETPALADIAESKSTQWTLWKTELKKFQTPSGYREVAPSSVSLVFDTCEDPSPSSDIQAKASTRRQNYELSQGPILNFDSGWEYRQASEATGRVSYTPGGDSTTTSPYMNGITKDNSWIKYQNKFTLVETTNAVYVPTLGVMLAEDLNTPDTAYSQKDKSGFRIVGATDVSGLDYDNDLIQAFGKPIYKVRMEGYALRVGYQIPCPSLKSISLKVGVSSPVEHSAYRIGEQQWSHNLVEASDEVPVFMAMWSQEYAVLAPPTTADDIKFETSGNPAEFV